MILQYNPAISTMAATTMADLSKKLVFSSHPSFISTQPLSFTLLIRNCGILSINEKIQEPGMIT